MLRLFPSRSGSVLAAESADWLKSAVWMSLATDRRALSDDVLPGAADDKRGWWGDTFRSRPVGSRLWLLAREKQLEQVPLRAQEYAREALEWLISDKVAARLNVSAHWAAQGFLKLNIDIAKPEGGNYRYHYLWSKDNGISAT